MANEFTKVELLGPNEDGAIRKFAIDNTLAVSKGSLLALLDPRTASLALHTTVAYAGIASEDHEANQNVTVIGAWTDGIFEANASDAITCGAPITGGSSNQVVVADTAVASGAKVLGYALEAAASAETINVRVRL
jgi:hypothetical protein